MPIDLIPDFIPVAGQLDGAILVALVLRNALRGRMSRSSWNFGRRSRCDGQAGTRVATSSVDVSERSISRSRARASAASCL